MRYLGSKERFCKDIVPILQKCIDEHSVDTYIEPFCGGCSLICKIKCKNRLAYDRSDTLIALLQLAQKDFSKVLKNGNRDLWDKGKAYVKDGVMPSDMSLADIGAMEFFASFSNRGFPGGYARDVPGRNYFKEGYASLEKQAPQLEGISFGCQNYWELSPEIQGAVILLDPPYQGTIGYGYARQQKMDYDHFWNWVRELSKQNYVFICEQAAPDDFKCIWEKETRRTCDVKNQTRATEKLFVWGGGMD